MAKSKKSESASGAAKPKGKQVAKAVSAIAAAATPQAAEITRKPQTAEAPKRVEPVRKPTAEQVSARAHQIWIDAGKPQGLSLDHWLRAERELS